MPPRAYEIRVTWHLDIPTTVGKVARDPGIIQRDDRIACVFLREQQTRVGRTAQVVLLIDEAAKRLGERTDRRLDVEMAGPSC